MTKRQRQRLAACVERNGPLANRVALSWLMMMYARASPDDLDATAKLEDCYHLLHFGHWPRWLGTSTYCQDCGILGWRPS